MSREFSLYLDLVRFAAAIVVLLAHVDIVRFGHSAVMVFFVLSGFVIAYVADKKERGGRDYAASRMARIYSVALPALLLTIIADSVGGHYAPVVYAGNAPHDWFLVRLTSSVFFMNEFWGISIQAFSNVPYWSLNYEVWYYILFGLFVFWKSPGRPWVLATALLLCGPKILLLMPIWLAGVHLYRAPIWTRLQNKTAIAFYVLSWILLVVFHWLDLIEYFAGIVKNIVGADFYWNRLAYSKRFLGEYVLGLIVLLNFASFRGASAKLGRYLLPFAKIIRWAAGFTLSIYLFHYPLLLLYTALIRGSLSATVGSRIAVMSLVLVSIALLGMVTEHHKDRYRGFFVRLLTRSEALIQKRLPELRSDQSSLRT